MTAKSNAREGDGVADALVELALREGVRVLYTLTDAEADKWREYCDSVDADDLPELMRAAIAAMQAQQGAEPKLIAYSEMKPTADPDVFEHHLWMLAPGMEVPAGCTPLYYYPDGAPR